MGSSSKLVDFHAHFLTPEVMREAAPRWILSGFGTRPPNGAPLSRGLPDPRSSGSADEGDFKQYHATIEVTDKLTQAMAPIYTNTIQTSDLDSGWNFDVEFNEIGNSLDCLRQNVTIAARVYGLRSSP